MDSYRIFHADTHLQTPISSFRTPNTSNFVKIPKMKNVVANSFRTLFKKTPLAKILRPNLWAKNDPMVILSLSTFRGKVRFDCIFPIEIPLFRGKRLFHFKLPGIHFEWLLFSFEYYLCYYCDLLFSAPWPWLPGCSARARPELTSVSQSPSQAGLGPRRDLGRFWRGRGLSSPINSS